MTVRHETLAWRKVRTAQDRAADAITRFAGSMAFVYLHVVWFSLWVAANSGLVPGLGIFDEFPFGLLTLVVSLEAIFLATFVMISQNREAVRADVRAELDFETNLRAELLVRAIAETSGVDVAAVERAVVAELTKARAQLKESAPPSRGVGG
jgi:uncharacterized membrane protein